jgi:hypothetical protein
LLRKRSSSRFKIEKSTEKYRLRNYFIFDFKFLDELEKINEDTVAEDLEKTFNDSGASLIKNIIQKLILDDFIF